jgi:DNA invertase Pin-like site-specific DNA recombinase
LERRRRKVRMKAIIYARCSTDETKQDVEVQLKELREYCKNKNWEFEEFFDYGSGYKGLPDNLKNVLSLIEKGQCNILIVHSLSRFSRQHPKTTEKLLNFVTERCRFISMQENLDSENEMLWYSFKGFLIYMNNLYSKNLSEKTRLGMQRAKAKGSQIGRPTGSKDKRIRSKKGYYLRTKEKLPFLGINKGAFI